MDFRRWMLVALCAALGAGASFARVVVRRRRRRPAWTSQGGTTGDGTGTGTTTAPVTVDTTATDPAALQTRDGRGGRVLAASRRPRW